jgi:hypothetical protein
MATRTFQIWDTEDGPFLIQKDKNQAYLLSCEDRKLLHEFEANSPIEMCIMYNKLLGIGKYIPKRDKNGNLYGDDFKEFEEEEEEA